MPVGSKLGSIEKGTIRGINNNGTVRVALDRGRLLGEVPEFTVPFPLFWAGPEGQFIGGYPVVGSSVALSQGQGGEWTIINYVPSNRVFGTSFTSDTNTKMSALQPDSILLQTKNDNRTTINPKEGTKIGNSKNFYHINPNLNILSHNLKEEFSSTEVGLNIEQKVKRDKSANLARNVLGSTLDSQIYDNQLTTIGLDPITSINPKTVGEMVRNPPLVEKRELVYELSRAYDFSTDAQESARYADPNTQISKPEVSRRNMRSDAFSLSLEHPNHLMETVKGTGVDAFGNVIDLNRNIIPIGREDDFSLRKSKNKQDAFNRIRALHRRALAFHWEINVRKGGVDPVALEPPDVEDNSNYARDRSKFFVDIDKEGQFKINIPASSEVGNVPLHARYENYSVLKSKENKEGIHPNQFVRNVENRDIFLTNYGSKTSIQLNSSGESLGAAAPIDYQNDTPIKYGTAFHDITNTCFSFQESSPFLENDRSLINFDPNHRLNNETVGWSPLPYIVSDTITVSGPEANAGGRSGQINTDGFLSLNIGANTIDRQSLWIDCAGGVVANYGKDKNNVSYAASMDGDVLLQVGGPGIGNSFDSRFADQNDGLYLGNLQIHVITSNGVMVFKMGTDASGAAAVDIASPGKITLSSQQDMLFKSNSRMMFEAPTIEMHAGSVKRQVLKKPGRSI